ncbi:MAG: hypothetical protein VW801_05385 [Candidatus Puniceispirillum sp.]
MTGSLKQTWRIKTDIALKYHQRAPNGYGPYQMNGHQPDKANQTKNGRETRPFWMVLWLSPTGSGDAAGA